MTTKLGNWIFQNVFFLWLAAWLFVTLHNPLVAGPVAAWCLVYLLSAFLPFEAYGAIHSRLNDTLSETIWRFTRGKKARAWAGRLFGLALGVQIASIPFMMNGVAVAFFAYAPVVILAGAVISWLMWHFDDEAGKHG